MRIIVCGDTDHFADRAAGHIKERLAGANGPISLGLAGGNTPQPIYRKLAAEPLDWTRTVLWLGDERWVPIDHPDSNSGMAQRLLAEHVDARFLPFPYDPESGPAASAMRYAEALAEVTDDDAERIVLLGMGSDGHTASLFPETDALSAGGIYTATWVAAHETWRVTATMGYLQNAAELVFLVTGPDKAHVLADVVNGSDDYPAGQLVATASADVTFVVDAAAASRLTDSLT